MTKARQLTQLDLPGMDPFESGNIPEWRSFCGVHPKEYPCADFQSTKEKAARRSDAKQDEPKERT